jgi:hypothetical protein
MSIARRSLQIVAFVCTLVIGAASMAVIVTQTTWFKEWLRGFIVKQAEDYVNGRLSIGRLDGNLFFGVELEDVDVTVDGRTVVGIKDVGLDYNAFTFIKGGVVLDDIRLNRPTLVVRRTASGWNLAQLIKVRTPDPDEPKNRRTIEIGEIGISDGTIEVEGDVAGATGVEVPARIERLDASVGVRSNEDELLVNIAHVSLRGRAPDIGLNAMSGVIRRTPDAIVFENVSLRTEESALRVAGRVNRVERGTPVVEVKASSDKVVLDEIARIVPALRGYAMQPAFEVAASGPADRLDVELNLRDGALGQVRSRLTVDATSPGRRVAGTAEVEQLNAGALVRREPAAGQPPASFRTDITGRGRFDLALPADRMPLSGTYAVDASHADVAGYVVRNLTARGRIDGQTLQIAAASAAAYGGRATAQGTVRLGSPLALNLTGRAVNVDLRNLPASVPAPRAASNLHFGYTLDARGRVFSGDVRFDQSTFADATIAPGTVATFRVGAGAPQYSAKGQVTGLDVQQVGRGLGIEALARDRFRGRVNGTFDVTGSGGGRRYPLELTAAGTLVDTEMFGAGFPRLDFTTNIAGADLRVAAKGDVSGLDPAALANDQRVAGDVNGTVDVTTTIRNYRDGVTVESIEAAGRIDLAMSRVAGFAVDTATLAGSFANRSGQVEQLAVMGPDVNVTGQGSLALDETGDSNFTLHAETPSLQRIGEIVGQPLKGAAIVDATVTGNGRALKAAGTLTGSNIGHGESEALSLMSTFTVGIPELTPGNATVQAKSVATFLEVGGQTLNEVTADTTYAKESLAFQTLITQEQRQLSAGGEVVLHPDHQEVHLRELALRAEKIEWRTTPGTESTIQYGGSRVAVKNLQLASGDQRLTVDGVLGSDGESLRVKAENVDVAELDRLALGDQRISGRLSADATLTGALKAPRVEAQFSLAPGTFRTFKFDSFGGMVQYGGQGVDIDVRLQQTPAAWLTAKGTAPLTLFQPTPPEMGDVHDAPVGDPVNIDIATSQIDLGVVQGFTSDVTNVTGALQANVKITGSGYDPHLDGAIEIRGGAFALPDLGTDYTGLDTRIVLQPDAMEIREFKILDNRGFPMTIGGRLAMHERALGEVNVTIQSENFEVIDNQFADLKLDTDLRVTGELRKPRLEGSVEVENGTIHVTRLVERVTADPYATEPTAFETPGAPVTTPDPAAQPGVFNALAMDLNLRVPDNLVLRGNDVRPANAPIEIGDVNVTVGGTVLLRKQPGARLAVQGDVNTVRGSYTFQGRRFDILRDGHIRFDGSQDIDPLIDIRAQRTISGVETVVRVQGTMRQPELAFSSTPPLDQADILSLIVFNQPVNELGEGEQVSLAQRAGALAGGYLTSGLSRSIGNALELDEFEIQAQGEGGSGPSLTVGEQVGERLFVRLRQAFGSEQATEFILEYQIADFLRLQGNAADTSGSNQRVTFRRIERGGLDLIFFFSY